MRQCLVHSQAQQVVSFKLNCGSPEPFASLPNPGLIREIRDKPAFKTIKKLDYPVNVLRNAARKAATTRYVLVNTTFIAATL